MKPAMDVPCFLDVMDILVDDPETRFWIGRGFQYKKIGRPRKPVEGSPEFVAGADLSLSLDNLVWNEERLNLSALFTIPGKALIGKNDLSLPEEYPCTKFRTFTLVQDGRLNVTSAPFSMSRPTFDILKSFGVLGGMVNKEGKETQVQDWFKDAPYLVNFKNVPLINGQIALEAPNTDYLCANLVDVLNYEARLRVWNAKAKLLKEAGVAVAQEGLTPEQQAYLESRGIVKGVYRPKTEEGEASDSYIAPTLAINIKGFSSLPSPDKVYDKEKEGKKLTPSESLIMGAMKQFDNTQPRVDTPEELLEWIEHTKSDIRYLLRDHRAVVQRAKFAILLGHKWFAGVDRKDPIYVHEGMTFEFKLGQKEIEI